MELRIGLNPRDIARRFVKAYDYLAYGRADPRKIASATLCLAGKEKRRSRCKLRGSALSSSRIPEKSW